MSERTPERKAYEKAWAKANPDKITASRRRWEAKNPGYWKARYARESETHKARMKAWYVANRATVLKRTRANKVLKDYGLTPEAHAEFVAARENKCAICGEAKGGRKMCIDHDHATGLVRGLLCDDCNVGLGRFKDDTSRLRRAIAYLDTSAFLEGAA